MFVAALENVLLVCQLIFFLYFRLKIVKISFKCKQFFIQLRKEAVSGILFVILSLVDQQSKAT